MDSHEAHDSHALPASHSNLVRSKRGPWSNTEDARLMHLVTTVGALNWVRVAQGLTTRTPKQCRERFHQNLKPTLNHEPITPTEGLEIERLVQLLGKRWAEIARRLNGRSDNAVKNWWNGSQNRRKRHERRRPSHPASAAYNGDYARVAAPADPRSPPPSLPRLPLPTGTASYHHGSAASAPRHRGSWGMEAPLPSPCSSESHPESDSASNYTISPRGSLSIHNPVTVELPPLRTTDMQPNTQPSHSCARLPSINSVTSPVQGLGARLEPLPLPPSSRYSGREQLPTAPNSPIPPQTHYHAYPLARPQLYQDPNQPAQQQGPEQIYREVNRREQQDNAVPRRRDVRMRLTALLR